MEYLVVYINDKGNEQKEVFESEQMVSGFVEQLLHMNQALPENIKVYQVTQVGFHVETIPVVKIDTGGPTGAEAAPSEAAPYEIHPYEGQPGAEQPQEGAQTYDEPPAGESPEEAPS